MLPDGARCRLSLRKNPLELAHIIPRNSENEGRWFLRESMTQYGRDVNNLFRTGTTVLNGPANVMNLRRDIHKLFDDKHLVFLPTPVRSQGPLDARLPQQHVAAAYAWSGDSDIADDWQGRPLMCNPTGRNIPPQYLFARFAWTVFESLRVFLDSPSDREVVMINSDGDQDVELADIRLRTALLQPRSVSPRKRARDDPAVVQDSGVIASRKRDWETYQDDSAYGSFGSSEGLSTDGREEDEPPRGRRRERSVRVFI